MSHGRKIAREALERIHFAPCKHVVTCALQKSYTSGPIKLPMDDACPQCMIFRINYTLFTTHEEMRLRGGCYRSIDRDQTVHQKIRNDWNIATIHGFQVFSILEEFVKGKVTDLDRKVAETAMNQWVTYRKKTRVMPGTERTYPDGRDEEDIKESKLVKTVSKVLNAIVKEIEKEAGSVATEVAKTLPVPPTAAELLADKKAKTIPKDTNTPPPTNAGPSRRSILKSQHPTPRSHPPKKVRLEDHATISSDYDALVTSSLPTTHDQPPPCKLETAEHSPSVVLAYGCNRDQLIRRGSKYVPGRWASPVGLEKQNTSWCLTDWDQYYAIMRDDEEEWVEQWKEAELVKGIYEEVCTAWLQVDDGR